MTVRAMMEGDAGLELLLDERAAYRNALADVIDAHDRMCECDPSDRGDYGAAFDRAMGVARRLLPPAARAATRSTNLVLEMARASRST